VCELLGLSADHAVSFTCSLGRFAAHGSPTGRNHDGWGVAAYEGRDVRLLKEPGPAAGSPWVRFMEDRGVEGALVVAHIRHATAGAPAYANTHPFCRELGGRMHVFAHNGELPGIRERPLPASGRRPVGETDSEHAFCLLLERLAPAWADGRVPAVATRRALVAAFAEELRGCGPANFLYADGELLFAHGHRRRHDDGTEGPPGLHVVRREDVPDDATWLASGVDLGEAAEPVAVIASVPLTEEPWRPLEEGELLVLARGRIVPS
jgi:predicted glutamine amidotransferase